MKSNPLLDYNFLYNLDQYRNKTIYAKITSLTTNNYPNEQIEGIATAGSITLDGRSAVRRVCSLTLVTNELNINNIYWGLSTRIKIEIGVQNCLSEFNYYPEIIWFPQGIFILTDFKPSAKVNSYTIKITAKDKMCLLNGDIGGSFNAETQLDIERIQQPDGSFLDQKKSITSIIRELVHHYAQESFHNIIIKDIDVLSKKILSNNSFNNFYLIKDLQTEEIVDIASDGALLPNENYYYQSYTDLLVNFSRLVKDFQFELSSGEDDSALIKDIPDPTILIRKNSSHTFTVIKVGNGEDIGYELTETYYPEDLIGGVGETVTSILDKIIKTFGEFEYFYNIEGQFVFQAKQTYVNTAWNNKVKNDETSNEYFIEPMMVSSAVKYSFEGGKLITSYSNNPQLGKIKNDFTVWGTKKLASGEEIPIHMRYAIDKKPEFYMNYNKEGFISEEFFSIIKKTYNYELLNNNFIILNNEKYKIVDWREIIYQMAKDYYQHNHDDDFEVVIQNNNNKAFTRYDDNFIIQYRPYEQGRTGYEQYYHDIEGFWRSLYMPQEDLEKIKVTDQNNIQIIDKENFLKSITGADGSLVKKEYIGPWNKNIVENPATLLFWFDFFDADSLGLGQFSVPAIGNRPKNIKNDSVRVITYKDVPDVVFINQDQYNDYKEKGRLLDNYSYIINSAMLNHLIEEDKIRISTRGITAQETIDNLLYENAYCQETISIQSIPIYYLEPNTIISARDDARGVHGYYILNKITIPLDYKGLMKITAIKVPERVY